jgi:predicted DNA-binding transcriptional regulator AlpA
VPVGREPDRGGFSEGWSARHPRQRKKDVIYMQIEDRPVGDCIRSRKEFAQRINVTIRTLDRMDAAGELPPKVQISERRVGYRESDIARFISTR